MARKKSKSKPKTFVLDGSIALVSFFKDNFSNLSKSPSALLNG
jgi:hypothetical protein